MKYKSQLVLTDISRARKLIKEVFIDLLKEREKLTEKQQTGHTYLT